LPDENIVSRRTSLASHSSHATEAAVKNVRRKTTFFLLLADSHQSFLVLVTATRSTSTIGSPVKLQFSANFDFSQQSTGPILTFRTVLDSVGKCESFDVKLVKFERERKSDFCCALSPMAARSLKKDNILKNSRRRVVSQSSSE
jgi:hypothetical protein